jgi:hypothetical protein
VSHFVTLVILPEGTAIETVEAVTAQLLEPYSADRPVKPYEMQCPCVGVDARLMVEAEVNKKFNVNKIREQFKRLPEEERTESKLAVLLAPRNQLRERLFTAHPLKEQPKAKCKMCHGTGKMVTHINPVSKWDWWVIGGRWDGWIFGPERQEASSDNKGGYNFGNEHHRPENNCRRVDEIPIDNPFYLPFAVVTPESEWFEQGEMGMWAVVVNGMSDDDWHQTVKAILAKYPNHLAVAVDCHL